MEFSIKFDTITSRWPIVYIEGPQVMIKKKCVAFSEDHFFLENSADNSHDM